MADRSVGLALVVAILGDGCGGDDATGSDVTDWIEPASYEYDLQSDCGERTLVGSVPHHRRRRGGYRRRSWG